VTARRRRASEELLPYPLRRPPSSPRTAPVPWLHHPGADGRERIQEAVAGAGRT
jgi:hypothetical protein